jgi:hypothetical protein
VGRKLDCATLLLFGEGVVVVVLVAEGGGVPDAVAELVNGVVGVARGGELPESQAATRANAMPTMHSRRRIYS